MYTLFMSTITTSTYTTIYTVFSTLLTTIFCNVGTIMIRGTYQPPLSGIPKATQRNIKLLVHLMHYLHQKIWIKTRLTIKQKCLFAPFFPVTNNSDLQMSSCDSGEQEGLKLLVSQSGKLICVQFPFLKCLMEQQARSCDRNASFLVSSYPC